MTKRAFTADEILGRLWRDLPVGSVDTSVESRELVRADKSGFISDSSPLCVVYAQSTHDVSVLLQIASEFCVPVVPRGAGTGLAGGSMGVSGEIVLSLAAMNKILDVDLDNQTARVQAGILNGVFNAELLTRGFWFAPDPASRDISTVGGNIATNAGGLMCTKYGVTREAVLGLTVVLADGSVITPGRQTVKGVSGFDLTGLFVGSEGILGVITEATVRILPVPSGDTLTVSAYFDDVIAAAGCASSITSSQVQPLLLELMDYECLSAVHRYLDLESLPSGTCHLLIQVQDRQPQLDAALIESIIRTHRARSIELADGEDAENLVNIRKSVHPALAALGTTLIEDVCVPRSRLSDMFIAINDISRKYGVSIPTVCHAGDGNLHPNFIFQGSEVPADVWTAAGEIFTRALELGGTLTGEHGVGLLKRRWLKDELGERQYELQRQVKNLFDPLNILNPGKVFA